MTMARQQLEALRETNNSAVHMIALNDLRGAYKKLQAGMKFATQTLAMLEEQQQHQHEGGHEHNNNSQTTSGLRISPVCEESLQMSLLDQDPSVAFLRPFVILSSRDQQQEQQLQQQQQQQQHQVAEEHDNVDTDMHIVCAVFLLNLALTCHRLFLSSKNCRQRRLVLTQARKLYIECLEVLPPMHSSLLYNDGCSEKQQPCANGHCEQQQQQQQIVLCACANLVDIAHEEANLDHVGYWYHQLRQAFATTDRSSCDTNLYRRIFQNMICYAPAMVAARAA